MNLAEENLSEDEAQANVALGQKKTPKAYDSLKRRLKEEELLNIGCINLMIEELERKDEELRELKSVRSKFHEIDKSNSVLEEKLKAHKLNEILYNVAISLGAVLFGISKQLWETGFMGTFLFIGGILLWIAGTASKFLRMGTK